jgi:hypothetical protein
MPAKLFELRSAMRRKSAAGNGPMHTCALCGMPFWIEGNHLTAFRGRDRLLYCSREHAEFGVEKLQQALASLPRRVA